MKKICQILWCPLFQIHRDISSGWLFAYKYYCTSSSKIFHLDGDVTNAGEGFQNLGLCSALRAFEQGEIFIVSYLLWYGASVFPVSFEGPTHSVASNNTHGDDWLITWGFMSRSRIFSSPELKAQVSFSDHLLSVVCLSWRLSVRHFQLLLQNRLANFNRSWHKSSLGKGDSELFKWRTTPFPKGR
jgi:hypothetical protein